MLGQRRRRWANINPTQGEQFVFAVYVMILYIDMFDVTRYVVTWISAKSQTSGVRGHFRCGNYGNRNDCSGL